MLARIASLKADHIEENWQEDARNWRLASQRVERCANAPSVVVLP